MNLNQEIKSDIKDAMRAKDKEVIGSCADGGQI